MSSDRLFRPDHPFTCTCVTCTRARLAELAPKGESYYTMRRFPWGAVGVAFLVVVVIGLVWYGLSSFANTGPSR